MVQLPLFCGIIKLIHDLGCRLDYTNRTCRKSSSLWLHQFYWLVSNAYTYVVSFFVLALFFQTFTQTQLFYDPDADYNSWQDVFVVLSLEHSGSKAYFGKTGRKIRRDAFLPQDIMHIHINMHIHTQGLLPATPICLYNQDIQAFTFYILQMIYIFEMLYITFKKLYEP